MQLFDLSGRTTTHVVPATWPYDKYPAMPELKAGACITLLDAAGPGVVTNIHASHYLVNSGMDEDTFSRSAPVAAQILLRVYYDGHTQPDIEMPFFDFLGDIGCQCEFFATRRFAKVPMSHNFRLAMPFAKHIQITLTNPASQDLMGYADVQYDTVAELPKETGYLYAKMQADTIEIPGKPVCLFEESGKGTIAAHWFCIEGRAEGFANGEGLCEANCEFYLNGDAAPTCEYLGVEDLYGFSWGFKQSHSDGYAAIVIKEDLQPGAKIGILRCREEDAIRYQNGCRLLLDYTQEYFSPQSVNPIHTQHPVFAVRKRYTAKAAYKTCYYYYK